MCTYYDHSCCRVGEKIWRYNIIILFYPPFIFLSSHSVPNNKLIFLILSYYFLFSLFINVSEVSRSMRIPKLLKNVELPAMPPTVRYCLPKADQVDQVRVDQVQAGRVWRPAADAPAALETSARPATRVPPAARRRARSTRNALPATAAAAVELASILPVDVVFPFLLWLMYPRPKSY